jgi:Oxidoreductase family, NAD-binding Rossmann fold
MEAPMKVAIIGAGRRRNGIGEYIAKYFSVLGAEVLGVLGTSNQSASAAAESLGRYGIRAKAFTGFPEMVSACRPDAVAIASPASTHGEYIDRCIEQGLHVFCEKPFLPPERQDALVTIDRMMARSREKGIVVGMNSQWPFCLGPYEALCGKVEPSRIEKFSMRLSPIVRGREMISDSVPHALSLLYCTMGPGEIDGLRISGGEDALVIGFTYRGRSGTCQVRVDLVRETSQPRTMAFGFNGHVADRIIDFDTYTIYLTCRGKKLKIADPLELSVSDFIAAAEQVGEPLIGWSHIHDTSRLLQQICREYPLS